MSTPAQWIDDYLDGIKVLRGAVAGMTRDQLVSRPVPGRWSTLEVICHLADSEQAWVHRMKRVIAEEKPLFMGYDEARFAAALAYPVRDPEEELRLFEHTRRQMARILQGLPEAAFARAGIHAERGRMTLAEMVQLEAAHVPHHVKFINDKRQALGLTMSS